MMFVKLVDFNHCNIFSGGASPRNGVSPGGNMMLQFLPRPLDSVKRPFELSPTVEPFHPWTGHMAQ